MKTFESRIAKTNLPKIYNGGLDRVSLVLGFIAIAISAVSAISIGQFGALILLVVPVIVFLVVVFAQPDYGLLIFIFITTTQISEIGIQFYKAPSIAQPLAGLLMLVIILRIVLYNERPLNWGRIGPVLALYVFSLFISMFKAINYDVSNATFISFIKDALGGLIVIFLIKRPASFRRAIWALIIAGIVMGTISVFQTLTVTYDNPYGGFGGWKTQSAGEQNQSRNRLTGPYDNPNAYSQIMVVIFVLALERLWHEKRSLVRFFAGWSVLVTSLTVVFTYSRGGVLTLIATVGVLFLQNRPKVFPLLVTALIGLALVQFLPSDYTDHIGTLQDLIPKQNDNQIKDPSFRGRLSENIAAWRMFLDDPFFGVGLGNYEFQYQNYSRQIGLDPRRVTRTPASLYLEVLSQQGLVGVIPFVLLIYTIFASLITTRLQFNHAGMHDLANMTMALMVGFAGYMIAATVKNSAYSNVYWILVGMALSASQVALVSVRKKNELAGIIKHDE